MNNESHEAPGSTGGFQLSKAPEKTRRAPWWMWALPFFMSAVLFLSGIFALFAPVPLLLFFFNSKRHWVWLAAATNALVIWFAGGQIGFSLFLGSVLVLALVLPEFLKRRFRLETVVVLTMVAMALVGLGMVIGEAAVHHLSPVQAFRNQFSTFIDYLLQSLSSEVRTAWLADATPEEWKKNLLRELPSALGIFSLVFIWLNLMVLLRLNPKHLREDLGIELSYFKRWKAPEVLLWPTIVAGALMLFGAGGLSVLGTNLFKFLMAIYALQGLSILSFIFDAWKIRGVFRSLGFVIVVFLMMPLLLGVGFFDQWFDFRAKLRQS